MPSLGAFLRGGKSKKSTSEITTSSSPTPIPPTPPSPTDKKLPSPPPQLRPQRPHSVASSNSLNMFRKKDKSDLDSVNAGGGQPDLDENMSPLESAPRYGLNSQSMSATNGLAALRINTPSSFRPSHETARQSTVSRDTAPDESHTPSNASNITPESPLSTFSASPISSTPDLLSPALGPGKTSFLSLPTTDTSFDTFNVNIDFTKFETKIDPPVRRESPPKRITNHDFLFLIDDGPGIDHRAWDTTCDLVSGLTKRLIPLTASKDPSPPPPQQQHSPPPDFFPPETPSISIRFVNSPRNISRIQNLTQIRNIFNWVTPRELPKYYQNRMSHHPSSTQKQSPANIPPLRTLEYHFWTVYNEKLQKNAWVGQTPTTIILFSSSPLGNRPEDMDLFIARCAEKLNHDQVPLPLISIMIVQCNADPILHRQLAETRRSITGEWYTPRTTPKPTMPPPPAAGGNGRGGLPPRRSMLNPYIPEQRRRPQRDWVDIITCVDWERAGGLSAIKGMIEEEIQRGTARRKRLQREVAMNYLTDLGKENTTTFEVPEPTLRVVDTIDVTEYEVPRRPSREDSWAGGGQEGYRGGRVAVPSQRDWGVDNTGKGGVEYSDYHHHQRGPASLGVIHTGRIDYYD